MEITTGLRIFNSVEGRISLSSTSRKFILSALFLALLLVAFTPRVSCKVIFRVVEDAEGTDASEPVKDSTPPAGGPSQDADDKDASSTSSSTGTEEDLESSIAVGPSSSLFGEAGEGKNHEIEVVFKAELDPGSWRTAIDFPLVDAKKEEKEGKADGWYTMGIKSMLGVPGVPQSIPLALEKLQAAGDLGHAHAQSVVAFLHASGYGVPPSTSKSFLYHQFAADGGSFQSKMALAYLFLRQQDFETAADLYAVVAAKSMATNHIPGEAPLVEMVRLYVGTEESPEALRGHRGEDDEILQFIEYTAHKGNMHSLTRLGDLYYWGKRGLPRDHAKAFQLFKKAAELGEANAMVNLGDMYARGVGVAKDYAESLRWFSSAAEQDHVSGINGLGYMHAKGKFVPQNYTKAMEYFTAAARRMDADAQYNLGVMHMNGFGVKPNPALAITYFAMAAERSHLGAIYQLGKMNHKGTGTRQNFIHAAAMYKAVAERGPWGMLLRWAHSCYIEGRLGEALLLYSRAAELGYEVAQSNAAWMLDKFHSDSGCIGETGRRCSDEEAHVRSHRLWRHSSEQGNVHAALLIGDAYFYGKGTKKDLERAVEAYRRARAHRSAQAMFNLGYMHEHGLGLPTDLHLAKRFYDEALETDSDAALPVNLALTGLWLRQNYGDSALVKVLDTLPEIIPQAVELICSVYEDGTNAAIVTVVALLLGVLYLKSRHRRQQQQRQQQLQEQAARDGDAAATFEHQQPAHEGAAAAATAPPAAAQPPPQ